MQNFYWILFGSVILSFNAGYINILTLQTKYALSSSHVTGLISKASVDLYHHNNLNMVREFSNYFCFLFGAGISGYVINYETFQLGYNYGTMLIWIALIQLCGLLLEFYYPNSMYFILTCCLTCGMQNGLTSKYSENIVRTTHITGTTTDLGITIAHLCKGRWDELWKFKLYTCTIISFFCGGYLGSFAFSHWNHFALFLSIILSAFCGCSHILYRSVSSERA
jgi:uncharacterized membrane protein YoaK (UPF0700 family)